MKLFRKKNIKCIFYNGINVYWDVDGPLYKKIRFRRGFTKYLNRLWLTIQRQRANLEGLESENQSLKLSIECLNNNIIDKDKIIDRLAIKKNQLITTKQSLESQNRLLKKDNQRYQRMNQIHKKTIEEKNVIIDQLKETIGNLVRINNQMKNCQNCNHSIATRRGFGCSTTVCGKDYKYWKIMEVKK